MIGRSGKVARFARSGVVCRPNGEGSSAIVSSAEPPFRAADPTTRHPVLVREEGVEGLATPGQTTGTSISAVRARPALDPAPNGARTTRHVPAARLHQNARPQATRNQVKSGALHWPDRNPCPGGP